MCFSENSGAAERHPGEAAQGVQVGVRLHPGRGVRGDPKTDRRAPARLRDRTLVGRGHGHAVRA